MALPPIVAAAAPSLISGVLGIFGAKKKRKQSMSDAKKQFSRLREAAERGGFNPLTALQATGTGGFANLPSSAPPLASLDFIRDGLTGISDELTGEAAERRATDRFNRELAELQLEKARGATPAVGGTAPRLVGPANKVTVGSPAPRVGAPLSPVRRNSDGQIRPPAGRPTLWSKGSTPMIRGDGSYMVVPTITAEFLKAEPYSLWPMENNEAIYGEETGQVVGLPRVPGVVEQHEGGFLGVSDIETRKGLAADRGLSTEGLNTGINWPSLSPKPLDYPKGHPMYKGQ